MLYASNGTTRPSCTNNCLKVYASLTVVFNPLHRSTIKNCLKSTTVTKVATVKIWLCAAHANKWCHAHQLPSEKWSIHCTLLLASTNQELFEKRWSTWKIWTISVTQRKPSCATTKSIPFAVSKDEWNTKEDSGKFKKNALYVLRYAKRHQAEAMSNSENIKPIALAVIVLHQALSQLVSRKFH